MEQPVRIPDFDEPEPDVTIVRGTDEDYEFKTPDGRRRGDAGRGLRFDVAPGPRQEAPGLCEGQIPVYWIVNLVDRQVEVYSRPGRNGYRSQKIYKSGEEVPVTIGGRISPHLRRTASSRVGRAGGKGRPKSNGA